MGFVPAIIFGKPDFGGALSNRIKVLEDNETIYQIYEFVGTSSTGQVTIPEEAIIFDLYNDGVLDAIVVEAGVATDTNSLNASGEIVQVTSLGSDGSYILDSSPVSPSCLLWFIRIRDEFRSNVPLGQIVDSGIKGVLPSYTNSTLEGDGKPDDPLGIKGLDPLINSEPGQVIAVKPDKSGFEYSGSMSSNPIQLKAISKLDQPIAAAPLFTIINAEIEQESNGITISNGTITINKAGFFRVQVQLNFDNANNTHLDTWAEYWDGDSWEVLPDSGNHYVSTNASIGQFMIESTFTVTAGTQLRLVANTSSGSATLKSEIGTVADTPSVTFISYEVNPIVVGIEVEPNNITEDFHIGQEANNNSTKFEPDGTMVSEGEAVCWDESAQSMVGQNIFVNRGRIDYNYANLTLDYTTTARYPNEFAGSVKQMPHRRKNNTDIRPHIHWIQNSDNNPNILIEYRTCNNNDIFSSWTLKALSPSDNLFAFTQIGQQQMTEFNLPASVGEGLGLSGTFECKIYRDSQNNSGLFAGADSYTGSFELKYYDIHFQVDMFGSREEFLK